MSVDITHCEHCGEDFGQPYVPASEVAALLTRALDEQAKVFSAAASVRQEPDWLTGEEAAHIWRYLSGEISYSGPCPLCDRIKAKLEPLINDAFERAAGQR